MHYALVIFPTEYTLQPAEVAALAEDRGFESLWFPEHTHIPVSRRTPWPGGPELPREYLHTYDPIVALTAAAAATHRIGLGTGIALIAQRDPITLAKETASLDRISGGRFMLGIGGGWNAEEAEDHGIRFSQRFGVLRERVLAIRELWTQDEAEFHGRYVNFDKTWSYPKPVRQPHPPIFMGGDGPTTFDRVVEFCDGWYPIARGGKAPPGLAEKIPELKHRAEAAGRDPASISVSVFSAPPNREVLDELEAVGVDRAILMLPATDPPTVRSVLDDYARLIR